MSAIYGRDREILAATEFLDSIAKSTGPTLLLEGHAGLGKSMLLDNLRDDAHQRGMQVLCTRAGEFERGFAYGMVLQLFAGYTGPQLSAALLERDRTALPVGTHLFRAAHELYLTCREIAKRQPLLILIDDAHWADSESLTVLAFLAARIKPDRIGLALSSSPLNQVDRDELLQIASIADSTYLLELAALDENAVGAMVSAQFGEHADRQFTRVCWDLSGGNPLYLRELLSEAAAAGLPPVVDSAAALRGIAPRKVAIHAQQRLNRLGHHAARVVRAVALLAPHADPGRCADVAQLSDADCTAAAGVLIDAGILYPDIPYRFTHPIVQRVVYLSVSLRERQEMHRRIAQTLSEANEPIVIVAQQLLGTLPGADRWTVDVLRKAAAECLKRKDPKQATDLLRRALSEPPDAATEAQVIAELGAAELRAGDGTSVARLTHALRRADSRLDKYQVRLDLAQALVTAGASHEAVELLRDGVKEAQEAHRGVAQQLYLAWTLVAGLAGIDVSQLTPIPRRHAGLRAQVALRALGRGLPACRVARLAASALGGDSVLPGVQDLVLPEVCVAAWVLAESGRHAEAEKALNEFAEIAAENGWLLAAEAAVGVRAMALLQFGRLNDIELETSSILDRATNGFTTPGAWMALAAMTHTLLERGRPQLAQALSQKFGLTPETAYCLPARAAAGRAAIAAGDVAEGTRQLMAVHALSIEKGWHHPGISAAYLRPLCGGLTHLNRSDLRCEILEEELARARAFGAARPLASALRAQATVLKGDLRIHVLQEAEDILQQSPYLLDLGYATAELGAAFRVAGHKAQGRQRLRRGREIAHECGAVRLDQQISRELRLAGARVPATSRSSANRLTAAELRVTLRAADGMSNKQIAQTLFITVKTVEWHLGQAFRKLGVTKRGELARAISHKLPNTTSAQPCPEWTV